VYEEEIRSGLSAFLGRNTGSTCSMQHDADEPSQSENLLLPGGTTVEFIASSCHPYIQEASGHGLDSLLGTWEFLSQQFRKQQDREENDFH
jgi:hypothetical protein